MHGSKRICRYPCLIAAYHVLLRLLAPRHPSYALSSLIILISDRSEGEPPLLILQSCIFYPICRCQRTLSAPGGKGVWSEHNTLAKHQNGEVLLIYIANNSGRLTAEPSMGLTGLEPVTLRLSSACSNQLSYRPKVRFQKYPAASFKVEKPWKIGWILRQSKLWLSHPRFPN